MTVEQRALKTRVWAHVFANLLAHVARIAVSGERIEADPEHYVGVNVNGGKNHEHPPSFEKDGKVGGLLAVGNTLYGWLNTQKGKWPDVDQRLIWSENLGATWKQADWVFPKGNGNLKPSTFLNFGKGSAGVPPSLKGYVYFYGPRQGNDHDFSLVAAQLYFDLGVEDV